MRTIQVTVVCLAALVAVAGETEAALLIGVTGDGAATPESLFILNQADASATFVMNLGNGNDGETIGFNPDDGLLYHASGISFGSRYWESIDVDAAAIVTSGQFTGPDDVSENLAMTYNPATGTFLVTDLIYNFLYDTTLAGVETVIGSTPEDLKGLAFVGSTLYGAAVHSDTLYALDSSNGAVLSSLNVTLDGGSISGMNGLATNPETGDLWGIFRQGRNRILGTLDPHTGVGTSVGILPDNFAGIAFTQAASVPEPSSLVLFGCGGLGLAACARRRKRRVVT